MPASGTFTALGTLTDDASSEAAGVSSDGRIVVGTSVSASGVRRAFRWSAAQGMTSLGFLPGGTFSSAKAVSADGAVIAVDADQANPPAMRAARWSVDLGIVAIPPLRDATLCAAAAASSDGHVIVGTCVAPGSEAFRWTSSQTDTVGLGRFGTGSNAVSAAATVSGDGHVVGGSGHPVLTGAVLWPENGPPMIIGGLPGDTGGALTAVSMDAAAAVGVSRNARGQVRAFRWSASLGIEPLDATDASSETFAAGISGDGRRIVGWTTLASQADIAVVWSADRGVHALGDLLAPEARATLARWINTRARAISGDGSIIVGDGVNPGGRREAWLVRLPD